MLDGGEMVCNIILGFFNDSFVVWVVLCGLDMGWKLELVWVVLYVCID